MKVPLAMNSDRALRLNYLLGLCVIACFNLVSLDSIHAQETEAANSTETSSSWTRLANDLVSKNFRLSELAQQDLVDSSSLAAAEAVLAVRRDCQLLAGRRRCDKVLRIIVEDRIRKLEYFTKTGRSSVPGAVCGLGGGLGVFLAADLVPQDVESEFVSEEEQKREAQQNRDFLLSLGPEVSKFLVSVPPLRPYGEAKYLWQLANQINEKFSATLKAAKSQADAAKLVAALGWNADLALLNIERGVHSDDGRIRSVFQGFRDRLLDELFTKFEDRSFKVRSFAADTLFSLASLAKIRLDRIEQSEKNATKRSRYALLIHQIRFQIPDAVFNKTGSYYLDYSERDFRARREVILELERLAGVEAIPTLRTILKLESSEDVRLLAALSLARLGDPIGLYRLQQEGLANRIGIPKSDLVAIYMDQGIKYLTINRYKLAEREFLRVLKLEKQNKTALYNLACCYSLWGKVEKALEMLENAVRCGFDDVNHIEQDPDLDRIRGETRYLSLVAKLQAAQGDNEGTK